MKSPYFAREDWVKEVIAYASKKYDRYLIYEDIRVFLQEYQNYLRDRLLEGETFYLKGIGQFYYRKTKRKPMSAMAIWCKEMNGETPPEGGYPDVLPYSKLGFRPAPKFGYELRENTYDNPYEKFPEKKPMPENGHLKFEMPSYRYYAEDEYSENEDDKYDEEYEEISEEEEDEEDDE